MEVQNYYFPQITITDKERSTEIRITQMVNGAGGTQAQAWVTLKLGLIGTKSIKSHVSKGAIWSPQTVCGIKG